MSTTQPKSEARKSGLHIAIAGAGIMGRTLAWRALARHHRVTLVDAAQSRVAEADHPGTSWTAAGMLTPNTEVDVSPELLAMGRDSLVLWPSFAASLGLSGVLHRRGCWVLAHPRDQQELRHFQHRLKQLCIEEGGAYQSFSGPELATHLPELSCFDRALFFQDEACIPPWRVLHSLRQRSLEMDCEWRDGTVVEKLWARRMQTDRGLIEADAVVDCRGLGASRDLKNLRAVRGELIEIEAPQVQLNTMVRLMHPRYALYIVPRPEQRFIIGATQIESDDRGPISVRSVLELLSAAYSVHPGFAEGRVVATRTHCRPALPDHHPRIGRHADGALFINGLYRHGILLAPLLADRALRCIESGAAPAQKTANMEAYLQ